MIATILWALLGGILPALIWLAFWLEEDRKRPEPKGLIFRTFLLGMLAVLLVLPFQESVNKIFPGLGWLPFLLWAVLEEGFKLAAAYFGGLKSREDNEPLDPLIYMITAALGFVAMENTLFIAGPLMTHSVVQTVITGNLRFIGASLLHTVTSGTIGLAMAFTFYKRKSVRGWAILLGFILAVLFHTTFNLTIFKNPQLGTTFAFGAVWLGVATLILLFERVKAIAPTN